MSLLLKLVSLLYSEESGERRMFSLNPLSRVRIEYKDSQQNTITWQTLKMGSNFQKKRERERDSNSHKDSRVNKNIPIMQVLYKKSRKFYLSYLQLYLLLAYEYTQTGE